MTRRMKKKSIFPSRSNGSLKTILLLGLLSYLLFPISSIAQSNAQRPNIIFFMTDDQGYRDVGYLEHPHVITPNIDNMAENGLRLDRFYASPYCSPSRASVLIGRHPHRSGVFSYGHSIRPQEISVITQLKQAGYRTGFFGKWHLGSVRAGEATTPGAHGFDEWVAAPNFYMNDPWMSDNGTPVQLEGEGSAATVEIAMEFIEEASREDDPFIVFIWTGSPHRPHEALPELRALYPGHPEDKRNYYGEITGIDIALGMLRDGLRELDISEQTLLWFTSDNGGLLPEAHHGELQGAKASLWEGGIRVPSVLEWPGHVESRTSYMNTSIMDLYPTFLELAGAEPDKQIFPKDGISLVPHLKGEMDQRDSPLGFWTLHQEFSGQGMSPSDDIVLDLQRYQNGEISENELNEGFLNTPEMAYEGIEQYPAPAAWMDGDWKLHSTKGSAVALYNLGNDPGEENNLLDRHPERVERMQKDLLKWQDSVIHSIRGGDY